MIDKGIVAEKRGAIKNDVIRLSESNGLAPSEKAEILEAREIFHDGAEGVKFRTVSWQRATVVFLKIQFAMSILAVPGALATLGAVGGALSIVGWMVLNTCEKSTIDLITSKTNDGMQTLRSSWATSVIVIQNVIVSPSVQRSVAIASDLVSSIGRYVRSSVGSHW